MSDLLGPEPSGEPPSRVPPGARANALDAPTFARLMPIDPRVADAVLDCLEDAGVAAWSAPETGPRGIYLDVRPQDRPLEQLYVDSTQRDLAAAVLAAELPGLLEELQPVDVDEMFGSIVSSWDVVDTAPVPLWPANEDVSSTDPPAEDQVAVPVAQPGDDEGHFVPPPPPPLPHPDEVTKYAIAGIVVGVLVLVGFPLFGVVVSGGYQVLGALGIVASIATLVWRMRDAPSVDDGPDDGAVV